MFPFDDVIMGLLHSVQAHMVDFTNQYGTTHAPFEPKRMTHKPGWMALLVSGETYRMDFVDGGHITNISYTGMVYGLQVGAQLMLALSVLSTIRLNILILEQALDLGYVIINHSVLTADPVSVTDICGFRGQYAH